MSSVPQQFVEQLPHILPDHAQNIYIVVPLAVVAGGLMINHFRKGVEEDREELAKDYSGANQPVFNKVIEETETNAPATEKAYQFWYRAGDKVLIAVGTLTLGAALLTHPTVNESIPVQKGTEVAVLDSSNSMIYTKDVDGMSRFDASLQSIQANNNAANLGIVQFGANAKTTVPVGAKNNRQIATLHKFVDVVDPNGGNAADGIDHALSMLPSPGNDLSKKSGEIIVYSDGTVDSGSQITGNTIASEAQKARDAGATVKIIVPGKKSAHYFTPDGTGPFKDGITPDSYASFGSDNITSTSSSAKVTSAAQVSVRGIGGSTETQVDYYAPYVLGIGLVAAGLAIGDRRLRKKKA